MSEYRNMFEWCAALDKLGIEANLLLQLSHQLEMQAKTKQSEQSELQKEFDEWMVKDQEKKNRKK